jgi:hypothetical protein
MLQTTFLEVGKTVIERAHPEQEWKVLAVFYDAFRGGVEFAYLKNTKTKEVVYAKFDDFTEIDPAEGALWKDSWKPADNTPLSSELLMMKKDASLIPVEKRGYIDVALLPFLSKKTGVAIGKIEKFLNDAEYRNHGNILFASLGRRSLIATIEDNAVTNALYVRGNSETTAPRFFSDQTMVVYTLKHGNYALEVEGASSLLDEEELDDFCMDWGLNYRAVKSSLSQNGRYTISSGE